MGNKSSVFLWEFSCFVVPVIEVFANPFYGPGRLYGTGYDDRFERRRRKKQPAFPSALKNKEHARIQDIKTASQNDSGTGKK